MITGIDHIELIVRDVKKHVAFFESLGFKVLSWTDHHGGSAELKLPGDNQPIFEIHELLTEENPGINHIAFRCDDVDATYEMLSGRGVAFYQPPEPSPSTGRRNALFRDPDGWRLQLTDSRRVTPVPE
jgi:catechol 2,3-dioxygenase-like lactoylglutathione lyase family enzyme